jgi:hypothetical protein
MEDQMKRLLAAPRRGRATLLIRAGVLSVCLLAMSAVTGLASSASATSANFVATGHDMDLHCAASNTPECEYFKIVVDKVRKGSTLPILALDQGSEVPVALANAGYKGAGEVVTVNPAETVTFNATPFVGPKGEQIYSAIITASDSTCGGCDNTEAGESNINARAKDFETYFNGGGGILALAGASRFATYYNFVPLKVGATAVSPPFEVTPEGEKLGITNTMANCCATHNSFDFPPPEPLITLEKDKAGKAETIAAFEVEIEKEKFVSKLKTSLSGEGKSGETITVKEGAPVTDSATLSGEHASEATGTVEYKVYSDKECKTEVANAGTVTVAGSSVPPSNPETLPAGTYYWQASYSGDTQNKPAKSDCGAEVLTVEKETPKCTKAVGNARFKVNKETQSVKNDVSTKLTDKQKFVFWWEGVKQNVTLTKLVGATCEVTATSKVFKGHGEATVNSEPGFFVRFRISINNKGRVGVDVWIYQGKEGQNPLGQFHDAAKLGEVIS